MASRDTSPVVEAPPLKALKPPLDAPSSFLTSSLSIAFDTLQNLKDHLDHCHAMVFQIEVVLADVKSSVDRTSNSDHTSSIDLSRDPRPAAKVLLAAQEAQEAQEAREAREVETALKASEAQEVTEAAEAAEAAEVTEAAEAAAVLEASKVTEAPEVTEAPAAPAAPEAQQAQKSPPVGPSSLNHVVQEVEAASKAPETQKVTEDTSAELSSLSRAVKEVDTSNSAAPTLSSRPPSSGNKAQRSTAASRLRGPADSIEGMRDGAGRDRLLMMQRASLPKGNVGGLAYTCEAMCGYDDTAADFINCDSAFHRKQPPLKLPTGEYSDRGWYHRPCEQIPPGRVPSTWICSSCMGKGRWSTDDHDYDDGNDGDQDDKPDADEFEDSEDEFNPGPGTPSYDGDDDDGQDENQDENQDGYDNLNSKNADKKRHVSHEDAQNNDQDVQNSGQALYNYGEDAQDKDLNSEDEPDEDYYYVNPITRTKPYILDGDSDSQDDDLDSEDEPNEDYYYVNPVTRTKPYILEDDSDSQDESEDDYSAVYPDLTWKTYTIVDDQDEQDNNQASGMASSKKPRRKPSTIRNSAFQSLDTADISQTAMPQLKTHSRQRWLEEEKRQAIRLMKEIIDEKVVEGEARFEETARRMQRLGYQRGWAGVKNVWNRGLRERSGYDERRNQKGPKTSSKQDAESKRKRKEQREQKEQGSRSSTTESNGNGGDRSKTTDGTNGQAESSTSMQTHGYGNYRPDTARKTIGKTQNAATTRSNGNATPRTNSQSPKRQRVADEGDDQGTPPKRQRSVS